MHNTIMFHRGHSLRFLFGNDRQNGSSPQLATMPIKRRHSFLQTVRDRKSHRINPQHQKAMDKHEISSNETKLPKDKDKDCNYKISTPDGRFILSVVRASPASGNKTDESGVGSRSFSIATCIYTCKSAVQCEIVTKKAVEIDEFIGPDNNHSNDYSLTICSGSSALHHLDKVNRTTLEQLNSLPLPVTINLCMSRCTNNGALTANNRDDEIIAAVKEFVDVALHTQRQLESVDEGRLGLTQRPSSPNVVARSYMSHAEFLASPPSIVARLMVGAAVMNTGIDTVADTMASSPPTQVPEAIADRPATKHKDEVMSVSPPTQEVPEAIADRLATNHKDEEESLPPVSVERRPVLSRAASQKTTTTRRITPAGSGTRSLPIEKSCNSSTTIAKSRRSRYDTKNLLSQFASPEEFRIFQLYIRTKSRRKAAKKKKKKKMMMMKKSDSDSGGGTFTVGSGGRPPTKRRVSPPPTAAGGTRSTTTGIGEDIAAAVREVPGPPAVSEGNKTPLISNKAIVGGGGAHEGTTEPVTQQVEEDPPATNDDSILSLPPGGSNGTNHRSEQISERFLERVSPSEMQ